MVAGCELPAAWLSLNEGDNDTTRFLTYLFAAPRPIGANIGATMEIYTTADRENDILLL